MNDNPLQSLKRRNEGMKDKIARETGIGAAPTPAQGIQRRTAPMQPVKLKVKAPERAAVNQDRQAKMRSQLQAQLSAAKSAGDMQRAREIQHALSGM